MCVVFDVELICVVMLMNVDVVIVISVLVCSFVVCCLICCLKLMSDLSVKVEVRLMNEFISVVILRWMRVCSVIGGFLLW